MGRCAGAFLLLEAAASLTALVTLFTEGVGSRGTQLTMALLTSGVLLCCLHREGLPRGVYLLRWMMLAAAVVVAAAVFRQFRLDHLAPMLGAGRGPVQETLLSGGSLGWTLVLPAFLDRTRGKGGPALLPIFLWVGAVMLFMTMTIPHEVLAGYSGLAEGLMMPVRFATNAAGILALCLMMLALFLAIGCAVRMATDHLCAPLGRTPQWAPVVILALLTAMQAADIRWLWRVISAALTWLIWPWLALSVTLLILSIVRRGRS